MKSCFKLLFLLCSFSSAVFEGFDGKPCSPRYFNHESFVCVCNSTYCDSFQDFSRTPPTIVTVFMSDRSYHRFTRSELKFRQNAPSGMDGQVVTIDRDGVRQSVVGFGGAFTDAAAINILNMSPKMSANIVRDYFGQYGLRYSMGRVPIGGSDFSIRPYTLDDANFEDFNLVQFKLTTEDTKYKIPLIRMAMQDSRLKLKLLASPWSAPAWMKTNNQLNGKGSLKGDPNGPYYHTYANYFVKFLNEYKRTGIDFWGITIQNEPIDGTFYNFSFNCMAMSPEEQRDFIFHTLGPKLNTSGYGKVNIFIGDDQRPLIKKWADVILSVREASEYVRGVAFHWYLNAFSPPEILDEIHANYPNYLLISSEASQGSSPFDKAKVMLGSWLRAESYAYDIIKDFQHWTSAWIDWNLAVNVEGGPNWANNFVDSPIVVNGSSGEYYKQPMYYALAHFTRFIPPGSLRLTTIQTRESLDVMVFVTPDNSTVTIVLNRYESTIPLWIVDPKYGTLTTKISGHSIQTFVWFD